VLNENRLLILGTQVLFGFQFNGIFPELFVELLYVSCVLEASGLTLLMIAITLARCSALSKPLKEPEPTARDPAVPQNAGLLIHSLTSRLEGAALLALGAILIRR